MTLPDARPRCRHCHELIVGIPSTAYGGGWVHARSNREQCDTYKIAIATPDYIDIEEQQ